MPKSYRGGNSTSGPVFSSVPKLLFAKYEWWTLYGTLVMTLAMWCVVNYIIYYLTLLEVKEILTLARKSGFLV